MMAKLQVFYFEVVQQPMLNRITLHRSTYKAKKHLKYETESLLPRKVRRRLGDVGGQWWSTWGSSRSGSTGCTPHDATISLSPRIPSLRRRPRDIEAVDVPTYISPGTPGPSPQPGTRNNLSDLFNFSYLLHTATGSSSRAKQGR
jgi:hypothetical protein